jgi:phosphoenolpyruvate synthase/pyruvate phosphate dikinase
MRNKYFTKVDFWARELRLPLFWMTDPHHNLFKERVLVLNKNNVIHIYHLDDLEAKLSAQGYKYFSNNISVAKYRKQVQQVRQMIKRIVADCEKLEVKRLSHKELSKKTWELISSLNIYSNTYTKTEPIALSKIEADEERHKSLIKELGEMRFVLRKEGEMLFYDLFGILLKEAAKRYELKLSELFLYDYHELQRLFNDRKVKADLITKRSKGYALICQRNKKLVITGNEFKKLYHDVVLAKPTTGPLTGRVAMMGNVRGRVRVILHNKRNILKEVMKFRAGEILVTEMTRPDTILACKKAAAIVTDEGGITSHAAIISRELKIPCVIATKVATQILKTGDLVEVDANHGLVKKITA